MSQIYTTIETYDGNGNVISTEVVNTVTDLAAFKASLKSAVKAKAEEVRSKYRTPGKDMVYLEKRDQAIQVHQMGEDAANALTEQERRDQFPTLAASVGIEGPTLWAVSQIVIARAEQWADLSYVIERTELEGSAAISAASSAAAAKAAAEAIAWTV